VCFLLVCKCETTLYSCSRPLYGSILRGTEGICSKRLDYLRPSGDTHGPCSSCCSRLLPPFYWCAALRQNRTEVFSSHVRVFDTGPESRYCTTYLCCIWSYPMWPARPCAIIPARCPQVIAFAFARDSPDRESGKAISNTLWSQRSCSSQFSCSNLIGRATIAQYFKSSKLALLCSFYS